MQVVILAGGLGSRLSEETQKIPKPLVTIAGVPIIFRIMSHFLNYSHDEFLILGGYKCEMITEYFQKKFDKINETNTEGLCDLQLRHGTDNFRVKILNSGLNTSTGGRIKFAEKLLSDRFFLTYGDGLSDVNLDHLELFASQQDTIATVTAVRPPARFGSLELTESLVSDFSEKNPQKEGWINGGYFVCKKNICNVMRNDVEEVLEKHTMPELVNKSELSAFRHEGFWHPMDTMRDKLILEELFQKES